LHGNGLPTVDPKAHLEVRATYLWADSNFDGSVKTEHDIIKSAVIPELNLQLRLSDNWWLDTRVFCPFGAGTHYDEYWQGAFHLVDAGLETINITPGLLWSNCNLAVRVAPQVQLMRRVGFSQAMFLPGIIGEIDGGDAWGFGAHLSVAYKPWERTEFSLGYWSRIVHNLNDGKVEASFWSLANLSLGGTKIEATTPDVLAAKVQYDINNSWSVWGLVEYSLWSDVLDELRVQFDSPFLPDHTVQYDSKDTWFFQVGAYWDSEDNPWSLLASVGWGSCFTADANRHPSLIGGETWNLNVETRYTWSSGISAFLGGKWVKWEEGISELQGASIPYGFPYGTIFGQLQGDYHASVLRIETGVSIPFRNQGSNKRNTKKL